MRRREGAARRRADPDGLAAAPRRVAGDAASKGGPVHPIAGLGRAAGNAATAAFLQRRKGGRILAPSAAVVARAPLDDVDSQHDPIIEHRRRLLRLMRPGTELSDGQIKYNTQQSLDEAQLRSALALRLESLPGEGATMLRTTQITAMLADRAGQPAVASAADAVITPQVARTFWSQLDGLLDGAPSVLRAIETAFILDPTSSGLDLLPGGAGRRYRDLAWQRNDFPDGGGPNEWRARRMAGELSGIRPERRVHTGDQAVVEERQFETVRRFIADRLAAVPAPAADLDFPAGVIQPAGQRLFQTALDSFTTMRAAAAADGVPLVVLAAWRSRERAQGNAADRGNRSAVAAWSAHTLGLAVDLQMSVRGQRHTEMTTRPMSNVVGMRESAAHKWMFLRGAGFGWFPYQNEPWHWEYNPEGFRTTFWDEVAAAQRAAAGTAP